CRVQVRRRWLHPAHPRRDLALRYATSTTGFPEAIVARDYNSIGQYLAHRAYTYDQFGAELGDENAMDEWRTVQASSVKAFPRGLVAHGMVGNIPLASLVNLVRGLTTTNMNIAKVTTRDPVTPLSFAQVVP